MTFPNDAATVTLRVNNEEITVPHTVYVEAQHTLEFDSAEDPNPRATYEATLMNCRLG